MTASGAGAQYQAREQRGITQMLLRELRNEHRAAVQDHREE